MKNVKWNLFNIALGMMLGATISVYAANKQITSTLVPPSGITNGGWTICMTNNAPLGGVADTLIGTTKACAFDILTQQKECKDHVESTKTPPAEMVAFINARLSAWRDANGY